MVEKVMPHNLDAERSVLGSMFLSKFLKIYLKKVYQLI